MKGKEIKINWDSDGIRLHVEGEVSLVEALGVLEWAKSDVLERSEVGK